jgi:hypothetical protein
MEDEMPDLKQRDDAVPHQVRWTEALVMRFLHVPAAHTREQRLEAYEAAISGENPRLPDEAVRALIRAGYTELG